MFRLRGKGVKSLRGSSFGDLICRFQVETPVKLTSELKGLLQNFAVSLGDSKKHSPQSTKWFDAVKRFFDR